MQIALAIRSLRRRSGLSQRQLAGRMQVPRTYVSKIENEKATPT
ncbi:MAG: transcriptional regulator, partial [Acidobacteria bacterium]